jgi:O-acetyl-ADP-ribose deacetylase (regulator of RNase III)
VYAKSAFGAGHIRALVTRTGSAPVHVNIQPPAPTASLTESGYRAALPGGMVEPLDAERGEQFALVSMLLADASIQKITSTKDFKGYPYNASISRTPEAGVLVWETNCGKDKTSFTIRRPPPAGSVLAYADEAYVVVPATPQARALFETHEQVVRANGTDSRAGLDIQQCIMLHEILNKGRRDMVVVSTADGKWGLASMLNGPRGIEYDGLGGLALIVGKEQTWLSHFKASVDDGPVRVLHEGVAGVDSYNQVIVNNVSKLTKQEQRLMLGAILRGASSVVVTSDINGGPWKAELNGHNFTSDGTRRRQEKVTLTPTRTSTPEDHQEPAEVQMRAALKARAARERSASAALAEAALAASAASAAPLGAKTGWFQSVFGFPEPTGTEKTLEETRRMFSYDADSGRLSSTAVDNAGPWAAGIFSTPQLREMRLRIPLPSAGHKTALRFVAGNVAMLHDNPIYNGAVFQAASQFNCLEFAAAGVTPEAGVACYVTDRTQGPACAIACAPGTVVRNYFAFDGAGQTAGRQVNTIEDALAFLLEKALAIDKRQTGPLIDVVNGYTNTDSNRIRLMNQLLLDKKTRDEAAGMMRVGVQSRTDVTCAQRSPTGGRWYASASRNSVTQVYASAISVAYSSVSKNEWEPFARLVLTAAYEATLYAAVAIGAKTVVLTSVGGGVFGNDPLWIGDAIADAVEKFRFAGLDVVINVFDEFDENSKALKGHARIRPLI